MSCCLPSAREQAECSQALLCLQLFFSRQFFETFSLIYSQKLAEIEPLSPWPCSEPLIFQPAVFSCTHNAERRGSRAVMCNVEYQLCAVEYQWHKHYCQLAYSGQVTQVQSFMDLTSRTCNIESIKNSVSVKCLLQNAGSTSLRRKTSITTGTGMQ